MTAPFRSNWLHFPLTWLHQKLTHFSKTSTVGLSLHGWNVLHSPKEEWGFLLPPYHSHSKILQNPESTKDHYPQALGRSWNLRSPHCERYDGRKRGGCRKQQILWLVYWTNKLVQECLNLKKRWYIEKMEIHFFETHFLKFEISKGAVIQTGMVQSDMWNKQTTRM